MSRRAKPLLLVAVILVGAFTVRNIMWEPPPVPGVPEPRTAVLCFREGGDHEYCSCLDRLESARAIAKRPRPEYPRLDQPAIRYALRHPDLYPVISADTLRCVTPRVPTPPVPGPPLPTPSVPRAPGIVAGNRAHLIGV